MGYMMLGRLGVLVVVIAALGCADRNGAGADAGTGDAGEGAGADAGTGDAGEGAGADAGTGDAGEGAGDCAGQQECTQRGCLAVSGTSGASQLVVGLAIPVAARMGDLAGSEVTGCRNDACVTGTLVIQANPVEFPANDTHIEANVRDPVADAGPVLEVGWGRNNPCCLLPNPQDGDYYSVEMKTSASVLVAAGSGTATYQRVRPNGPCCSPICLAATVTMTADGGLPVDAAADAATD